MHTPIITHMDADKHSVSAIVIKMSCRKEQELLHSMVRSSRLFLESCEGFCLQLEEAAHRDQLQLWVGGCTV